MINFCIFNMLITEIATQPVNSTTVIALEDVTLNCLASVDDANYSWHRVGDNLPLRSRGHHNDTLTIHRATPHDEGMYYCIAKKSRISIQSNNVSIKVDGKKSCCTMKILLSVVVIPLKINCD